MTKLWKRNEERGEDLDEQGKKVLMILDKIYVNKVNKSKYQSNEKSKKEYQFHELINVN